MFRTRTYFLVFCFFLAGWLPAVLLLHGKEQVADQAKFGLETFLQLALIATPAWGAIKALVWAHDFVVQRPERRIRARLEQGLCPYCAYSMTGNISRVCPECGQPI